MTAMGDQLLRSARVVVLVARVHRPELAAVNRQQFAAEELQPPAQQRERPRDGFQRQEIIFPKIRDGLEVG